MAKRWFEQRDEGSAGVWRMCPPKAEGEITAANAQRVGRVELLLPGELLDARMPVLSVGQERSAGRIQAAWRRAITDPRHALCRRRLEAEFASLGEL
jgi:hypothetical protein